MNERIKELVEKATTIEVISGRGYAKPQNITRFDKEKFAELIVKECADLFDDDPESGTRYTGVGCRDMIKWYFGVEL
jgi:hypothetical protein